MRWLCSAVCFGWAASLVAGSGSVQTVDGRTIEGDLRLTNGFLLVYSTNATPARFAPVELRAANFQEQAAGTATSGGGNGLLGYYFSNTNLDGSVVVRLDECIDFDWSIGEPAPGVGIDYFGVAWSGEVEPSAAGQYIFTLEADEYAALSIDGQPIADSHGQRAGAEIASTPVSMEAGKKYPLKLTYFDWTGGARVRLLWSGPGVAKSVVVPKERLYAKNFSPVHSASIETNRGLLGTYYQDSEFGGATSSRVDPSIDFNWSGRDPLPGISRSNLSVRWSGQIKADYSEEYTFHLLADQRAQLWIDDKLIIDRADQSWLSETKGGIPLVAGERYNLRLQAQSRSGNPVVGLMWSSASLSKTNVPANHLFPSKAAPVHGAAPSDGGKLPPGLVLRNGAFLAGAIEAASETSIRAAGAFRNKPLSTINVARILCQPLSKAMEARIVPGRAGVLLDKGDFVDGNFLGIEDGQVKVSSILFGTRSFDAKKEVLAVALHDVSPAPANYEIRLRDQSLLPAAAVTFGRDALVVQDSILGMVQLPAGELALIQQRIPPTKAR
jgi:hypothetical protein